MQQSSIVFVFYCTQSKNVLNDVYFLKKFAAMRHWLIDIEH
jgi:hypothetical protein